MGLFDDDFYSTKVSKRLSRRPSSEEGWSAAKQRKGLTTLQVSLICSVLSAVVAVTLYSVVLDSPSKSASTALSSGLIHKTDRDPYERIVQAAAKVRPSVVSIVNHRDAKPSANPEDAALGSGVIFKKEGAKAYIITNAHVIAESENLEVVTVDGDSKTAKVLGKDTVSDLAVLEVDADGINTVADMGDSKKLRLGETVIAIGNPLGLGDSLTSGIVSYPNRVIPVSLNQDGVYDWEQEVIQTDAAINEGNSGGALVNLDGEVIGINTMKISDTGVEGIGFAIPADDVMDTVQNLLKNGQVVRPYLGVYSLDVNNTYSPLTAEQKKEMNLPADVKEGVLVLESHGPAAKAGMKLNDVITELDGKAIVSTIELRKYLYEQKKVGDDIEITFWRGGKQMTLMATLTVKPATTDEENPDTHK
ncbi:serine protease Do [Paenibacillus shirakamiensis]|uniref:Serine protease Do n=1 Tax=Paenibacillus shirakamiensis TaxID=1265935 RepID=A0ABS4JMT7_9BACL|nr:trypsin-like peptidase domain-containing protein [Paenibacillus shirakamiensis]MBP2002316.1 serine protease Do [Paenibacillus shirakamiensis]